MYSRASRRINGLSLYLIVTVGTILSLTTLGGCTREVVVHVSEPLPLPVRPVLPGVSAEELACLSDEAYAKLAERQRLRRQYCEELEVIIQSTHPKE